MRYKSTLIFGIMMSFTTFANANDNLCVSSSIWGCSETSNIEKADKLNNSYVVSPNFENNFLPKIDFEAAKPLPLPSIENNYLGLPIYQVNGAIIRTQRFTTKEINLVRWTDQFNSNNNLSGTEPKISISNPGTGVLDRVQVAPELNLK